MCLRRVLVRQAEGELDPRRRGGDELYDLFRRAVDWQLLLAPRQCFSVDARVASCTDVPSALLVQMRLRDAICDAIRDARCKKIHQTSTGANSCLGALWLGQLALPFCSSYAAVFLPRDLDYP